VKRILLAITAALACMLMVFSQEPTRADPASPFTSHESFDWWQKNNTLIGDIERDVGKYPSLRPLAITILTKIEKNELPQGASYNSQWSIAVQVERAAKVKAEILAKIAYEKEQRERAALDRRMNREKYDAGQAMEKAIKANGIAIHASWNGQILTEDGSWYGRRLPLSSSAFFFTHTDWSWSRVFVGVGVVPGGYVCRQLPMRSGYWAICNANDDDGKIHVVWTVGLSTKSGYVKHDYSTQETIAFVLKTADQNAPPAPAPVAPPAPRIVSPRGVPPE
jgi:hypothetical protein